MTNDDRILAVEYYLSVALLVWWQWQGMVFRMQQVSPLADAGRESIRTHTIE